MRSRKSSWVMWPCSGWWAKALALTSSSVDSSAGWKPLIRTPSGTVGLDRLGERPAHDLQLALAGDAELLGDPARARMVSVGPRLDLAPVGGDLGGQRRTDPVAA